MGEPSILDAFDITLSRWNVSAVIQWAVKLSNDSLLTHVDHTSVIKLKCRTCRNLLLHIHIYLCHNLFSKMYLLLDRVHLCNEVNKSFVIYYGELVAIQCYHLSTAPVNSLNTMSLMFQGCTWFPYCAKDNWWWDKCACTSFSLASFTFSDSVCNSGWLFFKWTAKLVGLLHLVMCNPHYVHSTNHLSSARVK